MVASNLTKANELIADMEKQLESKNQEIKQLKNEVSFLKEQVLNKNRKIFGKSSEQVDVNQISFFNEAEQNSDSKAAEPKIEEITYKRKKPAKAASKHDNLDGLETVVIEHKLSDKEAICEKCGSPLVVIGSKSKEILKYEPAKIYVEKHITYSYACKTCEAEAEKSNIVTAKAPMTLLHKSMASNELLSHIVMMKYQQALPLYRIEAYFKTMDIILSRQTLSNWIMSCAEELKPVYNYMKQELLKRDYIHADETVLKVIDRNGTESKSKHYMWVYTSNIDNPIILYDYQKTRSSSCPKNFLHGFHGYLQTDAYAGYNKVDNVRHVYCMAHIRRKFYDIVNNLTPEALKKSRAVIGFNYCEQIYKVEKEIKSIASYYDDFYDARHRLRLEKLAPLIEDFNQYVINEIPNALPKSELGKALAYASKTLPYMKNVLTSGYLEIDNNAAERAVKDFVIGRKNWLFSNTPKGASSSALLYSIVETAKANGLIVERYLTYLFDRLANSEVKDEDMLEHCMPWSVDLPEYLHNKTAK